MHSRCSRYRRSVQSMTVWPGHAQLVLAAHKVECRARLLGLDMHIRCWLHRRSGAEPDCLAWACAVGVRGTEGRVQSPTAWSGHAQSVFAVQKVGAEHDCLAWACAVGVGSTQGRVQSPTAWPGHAHSVLAAQKVGCRA
ncbi:hypothetical protein NDU88_007327 [Pleurodeles waltl]|uniref:Uncharacterized protein n=1 Tax=Pleurodeles waltl TaxID=8319 RepID=A0AAV7WFU8_PLEWA|nr:hypothetical protein NDU88_007327 [Pleurodeles waltl]